MFSKKRCDHNHETLGEIRRLPLGEDSGLFLCQRHYHAELAMRVESGSWDTKNTKYFPAWELLKIVVEN